MLEKMKKAKEAVISQAPLIHCITNPISINDCANVVLALGAKPIMAEHPKEVHEITAFAKALAVNLGNITDARAESIFISGGVAKNAQIPCVIDVVGAACSALRMELAQRFIRECAPCVIKGNLSEIKALAGVDSAAQGIDVGQKDSVNGKDTQKLQKTGQLVCSYAKKAHAGCHGKRGGRYHLGRQSGVVCKKWRGRAIQSHGNRLHAQCHYGNIPFRNRPAYGMSAFGRNARYLRRARRQKPRHGNVPY